MVQHNAHLQGQISGLQAALLLQETLCEYLHETAKPKQKSRGDRLLGYGLPIVLTGDQFWGQVEEKDKAKKQEEERAKKAAEEERSVEKIG